VDIVDDLHYFVGVEMRERSRHICITNFRGKIFYSFSDHNTITDYEQNMRQICTMISEAMTSGSVPREKIAGIGICVPGIVDSDAGKLLTHHQYNWHDKDIRGDIIAGTGFTGPVTVDNDAHSRAIGVQLFRHKELNEASFFGYLFISRGLSCPFIINSSIYESHWLGTGELGYMIMDAGRTYTKYGHAGNLSSLSGERSIMERCEEAVANGQAPVLQQISAGTGRPSIFQILQAQQKGEQSICDIIANAITYLGIAIANVYNFIQPNCIFMEARIFQNEQNRSLFLDTVYRHSIAQVTKLPQFIFVDFNDLNGAQSACAIAVKTDLETYLE
ncbi:MAG: ROK family protein, partial [Lachnospiraceae bacterium]|nr:ROK family protein [Lachnospiraceae bacterium]